MLTKRIIPCLDVSNGRVVKGVNFENLKDAGCPIEVSKLYNSLGADEICFLDITASIEKRASSEPLRAPCALANSSALLTCCRTVIISAQNELSAPPFAAGNPSYHWFRNTDALREPGKFSHISSAVKLKIGAIQRQSASAK